MLPNLYRFNVDGIELDHTDRFVGFQMPHRIIRVPFFEINQVSVYERRISVQYKKSMNAIYRAEEHIIRAVGKEFERAGLQTNSKG